MNDLALNSLYVQTGGERGQLSARDMFKLLRDHILEVLGVALFVTALALAYVFLATPVYDADVLVRVDPPEPNALGISSDGQQYVPPAPSPSAEMAVMQSRSVLEPIIDKYRFDVTITPKTMPLLGNLSRKFATPGQPSSAWFGMSSYAWGGEKVHIGQLDVPHSLEERKMTLTVLDGGRYELRGPDGASILTGKEGELAHSANGVSMLVTQLVARPGTQFEVEHWAMLDAIKRFSKDLKVSDKVKDTGLVEITYSDTQPAKAAEVANAISAQYMATAIAAKQRNDSATLSFINRELPRLHTELEKAEQALSSYQTSAQSMQPTTEAQAYLQGGIDFDRRIADLQIQRTQLLDRYTPDSRWVRNIDEQLSQLQAQKDQFNSRFNAMPVSERKNVDLTRDAKVAEQVYLGMMQKAEELSVRRASTTGGAHIVDDAEVPFRPVKPEPLLILPGGVVLGLLLGVTSVFVRRHVMTGVTDPLFVEARLGVPLMGEVFYSQQQVRLNQEIGALQRRSLASRGGGPGVPARLGQQARVDGRVAATGAGVSKVLADRYPDDPSIEALRGVRTALSLDLAHAPNNIVMMAGPTPSAGKSFVAANMAVLHAEVGSRVLLIDADMRNGHLAYYFGQPNRGGLSEVLKGAMQPHEALRRTSVEGLTLMSCGSRITNPAALLMRQNFRNVLQRFSQEFDLVIVDTPPFLVVTDAAIIAGDAGATVLVLRSGMQSEEEIAETVRKLERSEARVTGAVFNAIPPSRSYRYYGYYGSSDDTEPMFDATA
ncbi:polysaccharide biosynthesis tyrosine autokinase [Trinickia acidisoli]|uniref:polysaccharide biosynthesis tyrosine autokinase n=1 Tax=Trinickia acidisoli TaxID=2767482 RepID=UPI002852F06E|nr:polysaccharide biosynthesis tyrosine autokinase [Trinickia acidisoli]